MKKKNYLTYYHIKNQQQKKQAAPRIIKISQITFQRKWKLVSLLTCLQGPSHSNMEINIKFSEK